MELKFRAWNKFDITKHEWSDINVDIIDAGMFSGEQQMEIVLHDGIEYLRHNRADAIAIARHFKLTAEDLS